MCIFLPGNMRVSFRSVGGFMMAPFNVKADNGYIQRLKQGVMSYVEDAKIGVDGAPGLTMSLSLLSACILVASWLQTS